MSNFLVISSILLLGGSIAILSIWIYIILKIFLENNNESFTKHD